MSLKSKLKQLCNDRNSLLRKRQSLNQFSKRSKELVSKKPLLSFDGNEQYRHKIVDHIKHDLNTAVRLSKILFIAGFGSRRKCDQLISSGAVKVNGKIAELGLKVSSSDKVFVYNKLIESNINNFTPRIILYNKPMQEIVSRNKLDNKTTVFEKIPLIKNNQSFIAIGRLDYNSSGLLVFTNCGNLAHNMMHPKFAVKRAYMVRVFGNILNSEQIQEMLAGIQLEDGLGCFESVVSIGQNEGLNHWYKVVTVEGRNHFVRKMFAYFNLQVNRLIRVQFGSIYLPKKLKMGMYYELSNVEVKNILF